MIVACPECKTKFNLPAQYSSEAELKRKTLKCSDCGHSWQVGGESSDKKAGAEKLKNVYATRIYHGDYSNNKSNYRIYFIFYALLIIYFALIALNNKNIILEKLPFTEPIFSAFGLSQTKGLEFSEITIFKDSLKQGNALVLSGYVVNNSDEILKSPDMRISFVDANNDDIVVIRTKLPNKDLAPKEKSRITHRIKTLPENTDKIILDLGNYLEFLVR